MSAAAVRRTLEDAGWTLTDRGRASSISELEYEAPGLALKARYDEDKDALYLTLSDVEARKLTLKIPGDEALDDVLKVVSDRQDRLDTGNYSELVNAIVKTSPGTQGVRDGELVDLEPDDPS